MLLFEDLDEVLSKRSNGGDRDESVEEKEEERLYSAYRCSDGRSCRGDK